MANGFAQSFEKAFIPGAKSGSDTALELIKDKIKKEAEDSKEKTKVANNLSIVTEMAKGADPQTQESIAKLIGDSTRTWDSESSEALVKLAISRNNDKAEFNRSVEKEKLKSSLKSDAQKQTLKNLGINFTDSGATTSPSDVDSTGSPVEQIQSQLPPGVSVNMGGVTITGTKVDLSQKKAINEANLAEQSTNRIISVMNSVPDLGDYKSESLIGKALGVLPRGLEGRAREYFSKNITAGGGGGITGLTKEDETTLRTYMSNLPSWGGAAYTSVSGDNGRLSDFDIERGKNLLWRPDLGETTDIRDRKATILKEAASERATAIKNGEFTIDPQTGAIMTPQVFDNALQKLSSGTPITKIMYDEVSKKKALVDMTTGKVIKEL